MNALPDSDFNPLDINTLDQALYKGSQPLPILRHALKVSDAALQQQFTSGAAVDTLVQDRARVVDALIRCAYKLYLPESNLAVVAVGGYGRGELHPHSDVDLLILLNTGHQESYRHAIGDFI
ncbi:MAG TPA: nucleotidyltransferase domain-containing protein, partial [Gammaproteobacteria bacterium]|nr:nucleotidyltransferase domain-containing protein [Gammaproteobacteria bacterium]